MKHCKCERRQCEDRMKVLVSHVLLRHGTDRADHVDKPRQPKCAQAVRDAQLKHRSRVSSRGADFFFAVARAQMKLGCFDK